MPRATDPNDTSSRQPESASESFSVVAPGRPPLLLVDTPAPCWGGQGSLTTPPPADAHASRPEWAGKHQTPLFVASRGPSGLSPMVGSDRCQR
jgi:hypothetical protein